MGKIDEYGSFARPASYEKHSRKELFGLLFFCGVANAIVPILKANFRDFGAISALQNLGGVNIVVWVSIALGFRLILRENAAPLAKPDLLIAVLFLPMLLWPLSETSWVAITILAAYLLVKKPGAHLRGAAVVFIAVAVAMLWAKLVAAFLGGPLETLDASVASLLTGIKARGNIIFFADGSGTGIMSWACSSFANASMAFLLWAAITRSLRPSPKPSEFLLLAAVFCTVFAVNSVRLLVMTQSRAMFDIVHGPLGSNIVNTIMLLTTSMWALFGVRREVLP